MASFNLPLSAYARPPTANTLNHAQRTRLMKSTDKLARVLGTTPRLLDAPPPPAAIAIALLPIGRNRSARGVKGVRRERSVYMHPASSASSTTSLDSAAEPSPSCNPMSSSAESLDSLAPLPSFARSTARRAKNPPRPLFIRLHTVPISPSDARFSSHLPPTPSTPSPRAASSRSRSRSTSKSKAKAGPKHTCAFPPTPCTPTFDPAAVQRRRVAKLARHLGEAVPPHLVCAPPRPQPGPHPHSEPQEREQEQASTRGRRGGSDPGAGAGVASDAPFARPRPGVVPAARQPSWAGEWNRADMGEVRRRLRALRL